MTSVDRLRETALHADSEAGRLRCVQRLLERRAEVNAVQEAKSSHEVKLRVLRKSTIKYTYYCYCYCYYYYYHYYHYYHYYNDKTTGAMTTTTSNMATLRLRRVYTAIRRLRLRRAKPGHLARSHDDHARMCKKSHGAAIRANTLYTHASRS